MHKDMFGRVVEVGDVVCWSGSSSGVEIAVVTQLMPKTIKINDGGTIYSQYTVIINEQMDASGQGEKLTKMRADNEKHFIHKKPVVRTPNPTYRYAVVFAGDSNTQEMFVYVARLPHGNGAIGSGWGEIERELRRLGGVFRKTSLYGQNRYTSLKYRNSTWTISEDYYAPQQGILLRELIALGLDQYYNQRIEIDLFEKLVAGKLPAGLKLPDFFK